MFKCAGTVTQREEIGHQRYTVQILVSRETNFVEVSDMGS
jgi:hypothetical protein